MDWLGPLLKLLGGLLGLFREQQVRSEAKGLQAATDAATAARETVHEVEVANDARRASDLAIERDRSLLRAPDEFERPG